MSNDGCMLAASTLQRAIELAHLAADMIAQEHLHKHRNLQAAAGTLPSASNVCVVLSLSVVDMSLCDEEFFGVVHEFLLDSCHTKHTHRRNGPHHNAWHHV